MTTEQTTPLDTTAEIKTFETFEEVENLLPCMKRPIPIRAKRMDTQFRVKSLEGDYKLGKPGDWLMKGIKGELYICDGPIFNETYGLIGVDLNGTRSLLNPVTFETIEEI